MGLPKLDADTTQCSARRQRTPRHHTGPAGQRDSPRRPRRTHDELTTSQRRIKSRCSNRKPGELPAGMPTPRNDGPPQSRRGHDIVIGPAPANSPPAHRPSGAAGLPAPLTPHIRRAHDVSTSDQGAPLKSEARRTPRRHTDTAERWTFPKLDADMTQCSARRQRTPHQHTGLAEQRDSPRRSRCITRNRDCHGVIQCLNFPSTGRLSSIEFLSNQSQLGEAN